MSQGERKGFRSDAQREASERNLRKGNPRAFGGDSQGKPREPAKPKAAPAKPKTIRAKVPGSQGAPRKPAKPAQEPAPRESPDLGAQDTPKRGLIDDVLGVIFG